MTKTIKLILLLKINYTVNGIFYYLKKTPLIKNIVPDFLRDSSALKSAFTILSSILMLLKSVLFKSFYQYLFFIIPLSFMQGSLNLSGVLHILIFTSIIGCGMNSKYFEVNTQKYYAVVLLKMEPRRYYIAEYLYYIFELYFGYIVANSLAAIFLGGLLLPPIDMLILAVAAPTFTLLAKNIFIAYRLDDFLKKGVFVNQNKITIKSVLLLALLLTAAYLPPIYGYSIPILGFIAATSIAALLNIRAARIINRFQEYGYLTKQLYFGNIAILTRTNQSSMISDTYKKQIDLNTEITSDKKGHAYLNDLFVKRHRKVLTNSAVRISIIAAVAFLAAAVYCDINKEFASTAATAILNNLPTMLFLLYFLNRGQSITQSMFINCDSALLSYNFYKTPSAILGVFSKRLQSLVLINLLPAAIIGVGLSIILLLSGVTIKGYIYPLVALTIMAMSVFFSAHYLVLYYLLQPYSNGLTIKNPIYMVISALTYLVCWQLRDLSFGTERFGLAVIGFTATYIIVSMILVYKFAPKTFRLK